MVLKAFQQNVQATEGQVLIAFEKFNIQSSPVCKKRDHLFLDQIERYNKVGSKNTTRNNSFVFFSDLALRKEYAKQFQIEEKVHDNQILFKWKNQCQRIQGSINRLVVHR